MEERRKEGRGYELVAVVESVEMLDLNLFDPLATLLVALGFAGDDLERRSVMGGRHRVVWGFGGW